MAPIGVRDSDEPLKTSPSAPEQTISPRLGVGGRTNERYRWRATRAAVRQPRPHNIKDTIIAPPTEVVVPIRTSR